jgi:hypothetical protein
LKSYLDHLVVSSKMRYSLTAIVAASTLVSAARLPRAHPVEDIVEGMVDEFPDMGAMGAKATATARTTEVHRFPRPHAHTSTVTTGHTTKSHKTHATPTITGHGHKAHTTHEKSFSMPLSLFPGPAGTPIPVATLPDNDAALDKKAKSPIPVEEGFGKALVFTLDEVRAFHFKFP